MVENFLERFNLKPNLSLCELLCATVDLVFIEPLGRFVKLKFFTQTILPDKDMCSKIIREHKYKCKDKDNDKDKDKDKLPETPNI